MNRPKVKFYTDRHSFGVSAAVVLMALAIAFRVIGCWGLWNDQNYLITQIALPIGAGLLFILFALLCGKKAMWTTILPVALGAAFFVLKALAIENTVQMLLYIVLCVVVLILYFCTVFAIIRTKWLLVLAFILPFLYHIFVIDLAAMRDSINVVTFAAGMQEMSIVCIMLGMFFYSLAMKKFVKDQEPDLPKIKGPKVIAPPPHDEPPQEEQASQLPEEPAENTQQKSDGQE